ncbi:MAG: hypothetical protein ABW171_03840 [Steroidobacter sp.]
MGSASAFGQEARPPTYASIRTDVTVQPGPPPNTDQPRPRDYFQLAGAAQPQLCGEVLEAFNEPGRYDGGDGTRWMLDSPRQIDFASLDPKHPPGTQYVFPDLEYVRVDLDTDGVDEHVYRLNSVLHSQWIQQLMIVPDELQQHPELLTRHADECKRIDPRGGCSSITSMITHALSASVPDKLASEWMFTRQSPWSWATDDEVSRELIYASRNQLRRNVGGGSSANWSLYKIKSGVVAVGAPLFFDFAPPELLVFIPSRTRPGDLQCVLMPRVWHERRVETSEP